MCEAKPGQRCAADTCENSLQAATAYETTHPDGPVIDAVTNAESQFGFRPSAGMDQMVTDELNNHGDMLREAARKGYDVPTPTLASLRDSMDQMPDDIVEDIAQMDASEARAELDALIARHGEDRELEALPSAMDEDGEDGGFSSFATTLPPALVEAVARQNALHATPLKGLGIEEWGSRVITADELGDDTLDTVEFAEDGVPGEVYVRGSVRVDLAALVPEGEEPAAWLKDNTDRVFRLADKFGGAVGAVNDESWRDVGINFFSVATPDDTVASASRSVRDQAINLRKALSVDAGEDSFASVGRALFASRRATA